MNFWNCCRKHTLLGNIMANNEQDNHKSLIEKVGMYLKNQEGETSREMNATKVMLLYPLGWNKN